MKLSVYVGLRAIAYCLTSEKQVVKHGIKRVNISYDDYYEYIAGHPVSKRVNRRLKAGARRNLWRYLSRRDRLQKLLLKELGCRPKPLSREENLKLRVKGLSEKLTPQELTNVLVQLQQKRGYYSQRGVSDNDNSDYLKEIERHEQKLSQYPSIAAYLLTMESSKYIIFQRKSYIREFEDIMAKQDVDDTLKKKIYNIIYYQRPLKKGKVSKCNYERNREVSHASNPLYQTFRVYRDVMNISIFDADKNELEIAHELRLKWAKQCNEGKNLTKASCLRDMGVKNSKEYTWYSGKVIACNPVEKLFADANVALTEELWQDVYSATTDDNLASLLRRKYHLDEYAIATITDMDFAKLGWSDFSVSAIRKLLPLMEQGMKLKEAIMQVYVKVDFENVALRNVVLEQHYHSCRAMVKQLRDEFEVDEMQIEIDHLLKQGNKGRKAIAQANRREEKQKKENNALKAYDRIKLQLWEESGGISPYEPDVIISKEELLSSKYNLDHIVPKSKLYERSLNNQVLCRTQLNEQKGRLTGLDFAKLLGIEEEYRSVVEKMPENKQYFMLMSDDEIPTDWISRRQNADYNTKCFVTIGKGIPVVNIPNKLINRYATQWTKMQLDDQDARTYLAKAWTMANMSQQTVDYFDNIKAESEKPDNVSVYDIQPELENIEYDIPVFMPRLKFSRHTKYGHTPRFALHQESVYGRRVVKSRNAKGEIVEEEFFKIRQPVEKLSAPMVKKIMDKAIREKIQQRISAAATHEDGVMSLLENPVRHNGKPVKRVSVAQKAEKIFALHSTDGNGITGRFRDYDRKIDYVYSDKNYCLKLWRDDKGRLRRETVALLTHINNLNNGAETVYEYPVMMLQENDVVEMYGKYYYVIGASETLMLRPVTTLSATETYRVKVDDWQHITKMHVNQLGEAKEWQKLSEVLPMQEV